MLESPAIFVPLTVVLELEWVMRGFYEVEPAAFCEALDHLLGMPHVTVDRWEAVKDALELHRRGLDFDGRIVRRFARPARSYRVTCAHPPLSISPEPL